MRPTNLFVLLTVFFCITHELIAQPAAVWTGDFPNKADQLRYPGPNGDWLIGTTQTDACVLNGNTGKIIWNESFSNITGSKKVDIQYVMDEAGVLFLYDKKGGKDNLSCLDLMTGKLLWQSDHFEGLRLSSVIYMPELKSFVLAAKDGFYMMNARSGEIKWVVDRFRGAVADAIYDPDQNEIIVLNYKTSWGALLSGYKNQMMAIDVASGTVKWETEYFGVIHNKPYSGGLVFDWELYEDKILLMVQGLQVIDRKTGKELWRADFDLFDTKGLGGSTYVYNSIAYPLVADDAVYLIYNKPSSGKVLLQKLDINTGQPKWELKLDGKNPVVPQIQLVDNKLILQIGGLVSIEGTDTKGVAFQKTRWDGPFGVMVVDANNGNMLWKNYDFKNRSMPIVAEGDKLYTADEKKVYTLDINSGKELASLAVKDLKVGEPQWFGENKDRIMYLGEDGLALLDGATGKMVGSIPAKGTFWSSHRDHNYFLVNSDKSLQYVRLSDAKVLMNVKHEKGLRFITAQEGQTVFIMTKKGISRYNVGSSETGSR